MGFRFLILLGAATSVAFSGSVTLEQPVTMSGSDRWQIVVQDQNPATFVERFFYSGHTGLPLYLSGPMATFTDLMSYVPSGQILTSVTGRLKLSNSIQYDYSSIPDGITVVVGPDRPASGYMADYGGCGFPNLTFSVQEGATSALGPTVFAGSECLTVIANDPSAELRFFHASASPGGRTFQTVSLEVPSEYWNSPCPPCYPQSSAFHVGVRETLTGTVQLTLNYAEPIPEPGSMSTAALAIATLTAFRFAASRARSGTN